MSGQFPPPWFPPPDPPFRGTPFLKGNQPGGKPIPATPLLRRGDTARLSFFYSVAALHRKRIPAAIEYHGTGTRSLLGWPTPLCRSTNPPTPPMEPTTFKPFYELTFECCRLCFGGQRRSATGLLHCTRLPTLQGMPPAVTNTKPCPPPPSRPRRIDRAEIPCPPPITARTMRHPGRRPTAAIVSRYCGDACPVPLYAAPQSRLPLSSSRRPLSRRSRRTSGSSPPPPLEPKPPA